MPTPIFELNLDNHNARHASRHLKRGKPWTKPRFGPVPWRKLAKRTAVACVLGMFAVTATYFYGVGKVDGIKRAEALAYEKRFSTEFAVREFNMADLTALLDRGDHDYRIVDGGTVLLTINENLIAISPIKDLGLHFTFKFLDFGSLTSGHLNVWNETQPWTRLSRWGSDAVGLKRDVVVEGGVTENNISANIAAFQAMAERLKDLVRAVGAGGSRRIERT